MSILYIHTYARLASTYTSFSFIMILFRAGFTFSVSFVFGMVVEVEVGQNFINFASDTFFRNGYRKTCLLVISISVSPSRPYRVNLFTYLYAHHLDRWNSFSATLAVCSLCSNTTITYWVLGTSLRMAVSVRVSITRDLFVSITI